nr:hypothetical protein [Tanacetum cinerariifolium]
MRRVGKGFSGVETPLFEGMLVAGEIEEQGDTEEQVQDDVDDAAAQGADTAVEGDDDFPSTSQVQHSAPQSPLLHSQPPPQAQPQAADFPMSLLQEALDACAALARRRIKSSDDTDMEDASNQKRMIDELDRDEGVALMDDEGAEKKAKEAQVAGDDQVKGRQAEIYKIDMDHASKVVTAASESVTATSTTIAAAEPQVPAATITVESTAIIPDDTKSKDKGKGIMVEEPKPLKKKQQVEIDEEYARKLYEELKKDIDWNASIDHVKQKAKEDPYVQRYHVMKKRPQTEAQARRNMIMYLKNIAGFILDYFKGMSYDDIRPIFEAKFYSNIEFLLKSKEQLEEEENRAIQSINETPTQKAAKRRKLNEEVEDLKQHLEIVLDEDDEVEDLESLWSLVKERFSTSKPNNFSDDYLLTTLGAMFKRPDGQAQVWKNQRTVYGQARVKSWKLLESCGVHIITFTTTQLILLVERRYPLSSFRVDAAMDHEENTKCLMLLLEYELVPLGFDLLNRYLVLLALVFAFNPFFFPDLPDLLGLEGVLLREKLLWPFLMARVWLRVLIVLKDPLDDRSEEFLVQELSWLLERGYHGRVEREPRALLIGITSPTDGANVEANLRGPLGLNKWASNLKVVLFSLAPSEVAPLFVEEVVRLVLPITDAIDSGPGSSFNGPASLKCSSGLAHARLIRKKKKEFVQIWESMDLVVTVVLQALLYGETGHQTSLYCAMLVDHVGEPK